MLLSSLPPELQNVILLNLDGVSLARAECVCKVWQTIVTAPCFNLVWRRECFRVIEESVLVELIGIEDVSEIEDIFPSSTTTQHVWKTLYRKWYTCKKVGRWPVMKSVIRANEAGVNDIQVFGDIVVTAHEDKKIRLWDTWTHTCLQTLSGHLEAVTCIALCPAKVNRFGKEQQQLPELLASTSDAEARVCIWDLKSGICRESFMHNYAVNCMAFSKEYLVVASKSGNVFVYGHNCQKSTWSLKAKGGHYLPVLHLSIWKNTALSVSQNQVLFWSLESGECLQEVKNDDMIRTSITVGCALRDGHAVIVKSDGKLFFWDFNTVNSSKLTLLRHNLVTWQATQASRLACIATYGSLLAVGTEAGVVFLYLCDQSWSEELTQFHYQVITGCVGLCCMRLYHDGEGPVLVTGHSNGQVNIFRWFSPSIS